MDAPIIYDNKRLISDEYITILCKLANEKFKVNFERLERLFKALKEGLSEEVLTTIETEKKTEKEKLKRRQKLADDIIYGRVKPVDTNMKGVKDISSIKGIGNNTNQINGNDNNDHDNGHDNGGHEYER
eukprot:Pgem_evm1s1173